MVVMLEQHGICSELENMEEMMQFGFREMIFTSLLLGMVAGTYATIVQPHARVRRQQLAEMRSMDAALSVIHNSDDGFDALAHRVDQHQQATALFRSRLPRQSEAQKAIDEVLQTAAANSLQAGSVLLLKAQQINGVTSQPIKLQFSGNFNGFYSFLLQLEGMPRVTRMTQLNLRGSDEHDGQIQADMTLAMYLDGN
jgi:Tfp pilus assembly protein PilO